MKEIWKDISNIINTDKGDYYISNLGRLKSLKGKSPKILKPYKNKFGYMRYSVRGSTNQIRKFAHVLVAMSFLSNPQNKPQINHIDGNKENNSIDNLEWCTPSENVRHAFNNGLREASKGSSQYNSKLCEKQVLEIRETLRNDTEISFEELAKVYSVSKNTIQAISSGRNWKHVGDSRPIAIHNRRGKAISLDIALKIKEMIKDGKSNSTISKEIGCSNGIVSKIRTNKTWKNA